VVVRVGRAVVVPTLIRLGQLVVTVDERGVIVLVLVVVRSMLELTERTTLVVVRDVVVIVRVHGSGVRVLVFDVTRHALHGLLRQDRTSRYLGFQALTVARTA
jgi:hypothetical protein